MILAVSTVLMRADEWVMTKVVLMAGPKDARRVALLAAPRGVKMAAVLEHSKVGGTAGMRAAKKVAVSVSTKAGQSAD